MREFKFRAWDSRNKQMYTPVIDQDGKAVIIWYGYEIQGQSDDVIMQYTGLKDKNGKEICEGDIFKNYQANINEVIWFLGGWHYSNYHAGALPLQDDAVRCEVIGNIYENPELME